ncbi:Protein of unknown function DUF2252 [Burkholderiaceae bacterium]
MPKKSPATPLKKAILDTPSTNQAAKLSIADRFAVGKSLRNKVSLAEQGDFILPKKRIGIIDILKKQEKNRLPSYIPIRYQRMMESPFSFYRGAAAIMAQDLACQPSTNIIVQLCGDMHVSNFGFFATAEHKLVFGINDFDETLPGSWEWDLKRLVASAVVACEELGGSEHTSEALVRKIVRSYREKLTEYASMSYVNLAYEFFGERVVRDNFSKLHLKLFDQFIKKTKGQCNLGVFEKFTDLIGKDRKFIENPPLIQRADFTQEGLPMREVLEVAVSKYRKTLLADREFLFNRYILKDYVRKVVGIGSVGTICGVMYFEGSNLDDPLFLQYKEAQESVLSPYLGSSIYQNQAHRIVVGQRLLQGAPDIFLGYATSATKYYYVRQLRDMKGGLTFGEGGCDLEAFEDYAKMFGWALALGHARSGDAAKIAGYLGESHEVDVAFYRFAKAYAAQNLKDYDLFCKAVNSGKLQAI